MKYIFDGIKMLAIKDEYGQWWIVTKDCTRCGQCCKDIQAANWEFPKKGSQTQCNFVTLEDHANPGVYTCALAGRRPFTCCISYPYNQPAYCTMEFAKVTNEEIAELL